MKEEAVKEILKAYFKERNLQNPYAEKAFCRVMTVAEDAEERQKRYQEYDVKLLDSPFTAEEFSDALERWSWNCNLAEIAKELQDFGLSPDDSEGCEVCEEMFVEFFGNDGRNTTEARGNWETIIDILEVF